MMEIFLRAGLRRPLHDIAVQRKDTVRIDDIDDENTLCRTNAHPQAQPLHVLLG